MAPRLLDRDGDGVVDYLPLNIEAIAPVSWFVTLNGCSSTGSSQIIAYEWTFEEVTQTSFTGCEFFPAVFSRLGEHAVTLKVTDLEGRSHATTKTIALRDYLIISIGDSFASGEGAPDLDGSYFFIPWPRFPFVNAVTLNSPATWQDNSCHRSARAGATQAAIMLEQSDPRSSVTFIHLACSGATIAEGLLGDYERGFSQVGRLLELVSDGAIGNRQVDALVVSIGGNDIGFSSIIKQCILRVCGRDAGNVNPDANRVMADIERITAEEIGTAAIGTIYELVGCISGDLVCSVFADGANLGIPTDRIFVTAYPDMTTSGHEFQGEVFYNDCTYPTYPDTGGRWQIDPAESLWAREHVLRPLNAALADAWERHGAHFIMEIQDASRSHGICSEDRWFNQIRESVSVQGLDPHGDSREPRGAFHPNDAGYRLAYAPYILEAWARIGIGHDTVDGRDDDLAWELVFAGTTEHLYDVDFVDRETGWIVGNNGTIVTTADNGMTWTHQESGTPVPLRGVSFIDHETGWAVGGTGLSGAVILRTSDGGNTWIAASDVAGAPALEDVVFVDANHGWAVGGTGWIIASSDGGVTWRAQDPGFPAETLALRAVSFVDASRGWVVGGGPTMLNTSDGGATWVAAEDRGGLLPLHGVSFVSGDRGWVVGQGGDIGTTFDGGASWQRQHFSGADLFAVDFSDHTHGWAVGRTLCCHSLDGSIQVWGTQDGGASWWRLPVFNESADGGFRHLWGLTVVDREDRGAWAVGDRGTIVRACHTCSSD